MSRSTTPAPSRKRFSVGSYPTLSILKSPQPSLDDLKLSHILNGETCPPIAFNDFATFVANKEFSSENLLFVVWFRSYRQRYEQVEPEKRAKVPVPSTRLGDRYRPFAHLGGESDGDGDDKVMLPLSPLSPDSAEPMLPHHAPMAELRNQTASRSGSMGTLGPSLIPRDQAMDGNAALGGGYDEPRDQPLRDEAVRAFSTFLKKGGSRELSISDDLREFARVCLKKSTAPEVFEPIYDDVYSTLEGQSLPHFLTYARANVNGPKRNFWYIVGSVDMLIGIIIFLILTLLLSPRHFAYRAIRLPSTIFTWFGAAQIYSAYRNFCSQVWGRVSIQLKPWEMDAGDEEDLVDTPLVTPPIQTAYVGPPRVTTGGAMPIPPRHARTISDSSEVIFTPESKDIDITFAPEVFPLSDLSGTGIAGPMDDPPWVTQGKTEVDEDEELSEEARARLAIRRSTLKAPDAALAFPVPDSAPHLPGATSFDIDRRTNAGGSALQDISPFDFHIPHPDQRTSPAASPGPSPCSATRRGSTAQSQSCRAVQNPGGSHTDLGALLARFSLTERIAAPAEIPKPKVFGPERVVQDPRVKALFESIVRDILVAGSVFGAIWVGLCFAVPCYGLAG